MMDETAKEQFKWKFYKLSILLNVIILLVALIVISVFLVPDPYRIPAIVIMAVLAIVLSWIFIADYRQTKAWLDEH